MKSKKPNLPAIPEYYEDPRFTSSLEDILGLGRNLTSFTNLPPELMETISTSPEATDLFIQNTLARLQPELASAKQDTVNSLIASGQSTGSVLADRLSDVDEAYQKDLIGQTTAFGIADIDRAFNNRLSLFGSGLEQLQYGNSAAFGNQGARNDFNLANYENQVAKVLNDYESNGGLFGGIAGGIGGALLGAALAPATGGASLAYGLSGGILGGAAGYFGPSGTGEALSGLATAVKPRSTATNKINSTSSLMTDMDLEKLLSVDPNQGLYGGLLAAV